MALLWIFCEYAEHRKYQDFADYFPKKNYYFFSHIFNP